MSSNQNTWEVVKGFCRRRTQQFREEVSKDTAPTYDADVESKCKSYCQLRHTAATVGTKLRELNVHVAAANRCIVDIHQALKPPAGDSSAPQDDDELDIIAKKLQVFAADVAERERSLSAALVESAAELSRFVEESKQFESIQELRKDNMLEYDFFRDKVAKLREAPPSDGTRIPRNDMRLEEWKVKYQDSTNRLMNFMYNSTQAGQTGLRAGILGLTNTYGRYCEDVGRCARAVLAGSGTGLVVQNAVRAAVSAAPAIAQNARQQVPQQFQAPPISSASPVTSSPTSSNPPPPQSEATAPKKKPAYDADPFSM